MDGKNQSTKLIIDAVSKGKKASTDSIEPTLEMVNNVILGFETRNQTDVASLHTDALSKAHGRHDIASTLSG